MNSELPLAPLISRSRLYTPFQVGTAAFFGGPFGAIYTLYSNFKIMGKGREQRLTLYGGIGFVAALCATIPFLPEKFPNMVIPLAYAYAAGGIASSKQLSKEAILASQQFVRHSGWNVTVVSLVSFLAFCLIFFPLLFALMYFGVLSAD